MHKKDKSIELNNIYFTYCDSAKHCDIFHNLSMTVNAGVTSAIMAPSGTGKTTLLHIICGLLKPSGGHISYPFDNPRFSMVFQDLRLLEHTTVHNNLTFVNPSLSSDEIYSALKALSLEDMVNKKVRTLSGGEKQRVAIARALMTDYDILILDEPFTGLDDKTKIKTADYIKNKTAGKTVLLVTHDKTEAAMLNSVIISL